MAFHRRISLSDLEASPESHISTQPTHHRPPEYFHYKPGGRDEFFRDLEAYQTAAKIHAQHRRATVSSPTLPDDEDCEAPSYDSIGEALPTIYETKIFKKRLLDTLRAIRDFTEKRRKERKWSNCFGIASKIRLALAGVLILAMVGGLIAMSIVFQQVAGMLALGVFLVVFLGLSYFMFRKYFYQQRLVEALLIGLGKVERFERIDDSTYERIRKGIDATLSPFFWIENERKMDEAIPEELRMPVAAVLRAPVHREGDLPPVAPPPQLDPAPEQAAVIAAPEQAVVATPEQAVVAAPEQATVIIAPEPTAVRAVPASAV